MINKNINIEQEQIAIEQHIFRHDTTCCEQPMIDLGILEYDTLVDYRHIWVCGECGHLKEFVSYDLDDEVLCNFMGYHEDELKGTRIFKEMMGRKYE